MKAIMTLATAVVSSLAASTSMAERITIASNLNVETSVERLTAAVEAVGAQVFNVVDLANGSATIGQTLRPTTIVILGSPKIESEALQEG